VREKILIIIVAILTIFILITTNYGNQGRVYDCSMAEWHPDIPTQVREECRRLRYEDWKRQQDESKTYI
jgi:hypothetical protein